MLRALDRAQAYSLTEDDISRLISLRHPNGTVRIVLYPELAKYESLEQLFSEAPDGIVLFYETSSSIEGHWCSFWPDSGRKTVHFFDPYGLQPDEAIRYSTYIKTPLLAPLIHSEGAWSVDASSQRLQSEDKGVATCGRWATVRLLLKSLSHMQFARLFSKAGGLDGDLWVTSLSLLALPKDYSFV